jgi:hypothetical protein
MALTIKNGDTDISNAVQWDSIDAISVLTKERGTLKFQITVTPAASTKVPAIGDTITLADSSGVIFGGTTTQVEKTIIGGAGALLQAQVTVTDYGYSLDSKLVKAAYQNTDPADIVADIVTRFAPAGIDYTTHVQRAGFPIKTISFNYEPVTKCIEALARQIGWDWYIDPAKAVHFFFATTMTGSSEYAPAPITLDDTSGEVNWSTLDVSLDITNLKNSIYVVGGSYAKEFTESTTPDTYTTVAGQFVYQIAYKYTGGFFVTVDGVQQSIGIDQQDDPDLFAVMYNGTGPFVRFTADPGGGHTLMVYGFAQIPIVAQRSDTASIATYGEYQDSIIDSQISSVQEAQERAAAELVQFGHPVYDVKFDTLAAGVRVGQTVILNSDKFGVSNYPLIVKRAEARGYTPSKLIYSIEAIGSDKVTFTDVMLLLLQQQNAQANVDPSSVLQILLDSSDTVDAADDVTIAATGPHYLYDSAKLGLSKFS